MQIRPFNLSKKYNLTILVFFQANILPAYIHATRSINEIYILIRHKLVTKTDRIKNKNMTTSNLGVTSVAVKSIENRLRCCMTGLFKGDGETLVSKMGEKIDKHHNMRLLIGV